MLINTIGLRNRQQFSLIRIENDILDPFIAFLRITKYKNCEIVNINLIITIHRFLKIIKKGI
jgi:hypothetical protein